jgi:cytochrome P450
VEAGEYDIEGKQTLTCCKVIAGVTCYRLTLHQLAKFPGSLLAAATDGLDIYRTSTGDRHLDQLKDHEKYGAWCIDLALTFRFQTDLCQGPVIRIGPNTLSFNTIEAVREIYGNRHANVRKAPWYTVIEASAGGPVSLHAETDRNIHASRRKVMEPAFTDRSIRASDALLVKNVQTFTDLVAGCKKNDGGWSEAFNMSQWSTYLNYDIMGDLVFGRQFEAMTSETNRFVPRLIMSSTAFIYTVRHSRHTRIKLDPLTAPTVCINATQSSLASSARQWRAEPPNNWR